MTLSDVISAFRDAGCPERIIERATVVLATKERSPNASRQASYRYRKRAANPGDTAPATETHHIVESMENSRDGVVTVTPALRYCNAQNPSPEVASQEIYNSTLHPNPINHQTPAREKSKTSRLSPDAVPSAGNVADATKAGIVNGTFQKEWRKFVNHHVGKGSRMVDWDAAWRYWCDNVNRYQPTPVATTQRDRKAAFREEMKRLEELERNGGEETGRSGQDGFAGTTIDGLFTGSFGQDSGYPERR